MKLTENKLLSMLTKRSCAVVSFLAIGGILASQIELSPHDEKEIIMSKKPLPFSHLTHHGITEKIRGPVTVSLKPLQEFSAGQSLTYVARIVAEVDIQNLEYEWVIPEGLKLIRGPLKSSLAQVKQNEPSDIEIVVKSHGSENEQINIILSAQQQGIVFAATAQYNTVDQPAIDEHIKALHEKTKAALGTKSKSFE